MGTSLEFSTERPDVAALAAALDDLEPAPRDGSGYGYRGQSGRNLAEAIIAALAAAGWRLTSDPRPCDPPTTHRYERIGQTDRLRCRRCGWERYG